MDAFKRPRSLAPQLATGLALGLPLAWLVGCGSSQPVEPAAFVLCTAAEPIEAATSVPRVKMTVAMKQAAPQAVKAPPVIEAPKPVQLPARRDASMQAEAAPASETPARRDESVKEPSKPQQVTIPRISMRPKPVASQPAPEPSFTLPAPSLAPPTVPLESPASSLPPATHDAERFAALADDRHARGFDLANRGAKFAARAEFLGALQAVVEGRDSAHGGTGHSRALTAGLTALDELEEFVPRGTRLRTEVNVVDAVAGHHTPVLKDLAQQGLTASTALDAYARYAVTQLSVAVDGDARGARALYALGKLYGIFVTDRTSGVVAAEAKAATFYQAALDVEPHHYMAANDLAVLLAEQGRSREARELLWQSVTTSPQAATWHNLAVIHSRLGETKLAEQAQREARLASGGLPADNDPAVNAWRSMQWVEPKAFAATSRSAADLPPQVATTPAAAVPNSNVMPRPITPPAAATQATRPAPPARRESTARMMPYNRFTQ